MISTHRIHAQATAILASVAAAMTSAGLTVPDRRYVTTTPPAVDCEQLVIQVREVHHNVGNVVVEGGWGGPSVPGLSLQHAAYTLWCHRCVPILDDEGAVAVLPTAAEEDAAGRDILADSVAMWTGLLNARRTSDNPTGAIPERGLHILNWEALEHSGGYGGGALHFLAQLTEVR